MLTPGLVSITFRSLPPQEIIRLMVQSGLQTIEWGGDIHVPAGDTGRAAEVSRWTREAGLAISAYGSYYRAGRDTKSFESVLASASTLGAPTIRIWLGDKGSASSSSQERGKVIDDTLRVADLAASAGITISLEYHAQTLTDTSASVRALLEELRHPNIEFLWQPVIGESVAACAERLREVLPRLRNVHVFHWQLTPPEKRPLSEGQRARAAYIEIVRESHRSVDFLLEFVPNNAPAQFLIDAATLRDWLADKN